MSTIDQRISVWCGAVFVILFCLGLVIAGWLPPPSPMLTPEQVAAMYQSNTNRIRLGMVLVITGTAFVLPFVAVISTQMRRMQDISRLSIYLQLGAGSAAVLVLLLPPIVLGVAAFRPDREPAITVALNDLGWLMLVTPFPLAMMQNFAIATGVFMDRGPQPVFPRWIAFFNIWVGLLFTPAALAFFFKNGPFAWNGLLAFWVAAVAFLLWFVAMIGALLGAIRQQQRAAR
jgi:hypothetical protein